MGSGLLLLRPRGLGYTNKDRAANPMSFSVDNRFIIDS